MGHVQFYITKYAGTGSGIVSFQVPTNTDKRKKMVTMKRAIADITPYSTPQVGSPVPVHTESNLLGLASKSSTFE